MTDRPDLEPANEPDPLGADAERVLAHLNRDHAESLQLLAVHLADRPDTARAVAVGVDRFGLDLELDGGERVRLTFADEVTDVLAVRTETVALVTAARQRSGSTELTRAEREAAAIAAIRTHVTRVARVEQLTPHLRQITFVGGDLDSYGPGGLDQFLYLLAPPPGRTELTIDQSFTWEQYGRMAPDERPVGAYYTVRRWRPEVSEIDIIVVLHGDDGEGSAWARRAQPGDPAALWGPRTAFEPPEGTDGYLLVADETGLPAVAAILEALPAGTPVDAFVELAGPDDRLDLPTEADARVTWFDRDGAAPGTTTHLQDAVRQASIRGSSPYAWGGAESHVVTAVRNHLRRERGFERAAVSMTGYWRLAGTDHDDEDDQDDED